MGAFLGEMETSGTHNLATAVFEQEPFRPPIRLVGHTTTRAMKRFMCRLETTTTRRGQAVLRGHVVIAALLPGSHQALAEIIVKAEKAGPTNGRRKSASSTTVHVGYRSGWSGNWGRAAACRTQGVDLPQWKGDRPSAIRQSTGEFDPVLHSGSHPGGRFFRNGAEYSTPNTECAHHTSSLAGICSRRRVFLRLRRLRHPCPRGYQFSKRAEHFNLRRSQRISSEKPRKRCSARAIRLQLLPLASSHRHRLETAPPSGRRDKQTSLRD